MCLPGCVHSIAQTLGRRRLLAGVGAVVAGATLARPIPAAAARAVSVPAAGARSFSRVVDLTHPLPPDFPTYFGKPGLSIENVYSFEKDKLNLKQWTLNEHTGTHLDSPFHFSADGDSADEIGIEKLVVPLCVIDIAAKAEADADAQLTPDDIKAFEAAHGPIPQGACVAMHTGWERFVKDAKFRNADDGQVMHFPGFHVEAAQMLMAERDVLGIAVDTLSLDYGSSKDFATHYAWLPSGRWGLECVAGLAAVPPAGATLVVGGPMVVGATGGPSRVIALV